MFCSGTADGWHWSNSDGTEGGDRDQGDTGHWTVSLQSHRWEHLTIPTLSVSVILIMSSPCRGDVVSYKCSHCQDGKLIPARNISDPPTIIVEESHSSGRRNGWVKNKYEIGTIKFKIRAIFRNDLSPVFIEMEMLGSNLEVERPSARRKKSKVSLTF